jgi:hypothetical protein
VSQRQSSVDPGQADPPASGTKTRSRRDCDGDGPAHRFDAPRERRSRTSATADAHQLAQDAHRTRRSEPMTPAAADIDRDLAEAGYGVALLKKEVALILRTSTRTVDRLIACKRLRAWRGTDAGSSRVLIPRRAVAAMLGEFGL